MYHLILLFLFTCIPFTWSDLSIVLVLLNKMVFIDSMLKKITKTLDLVLNNAFNSIPCTYAFFVKKYKEIITCLSIENIMLLSVQNI